MFMFFCNKFDFSNTAARSFCVFHIFITIYLHGISNAVAQPTELKRSLNPLKMRKVL